MEAYLLPVQSYGVVAVRDWEAIFFEVVLQQRNRPVDICLPVLGLGRQFYNLQGYDEKSERLPGLGGSFGALEVSMLFGDFSVFLADFVATLFDLFSKNSLPTGDSRRMRFRFSLDFLFVLDSASCISELIRPDTNEEVEDFSVK